jgi:hypothetical protein
LCARFCLTILGSGNRLREAVRVVTDGTLSHLSRSLTRKSTAYVANGNETVGDTKPSAQAPPPTTAYTTSTATPGYSYSNNPPTSGTNNSSSYIPPDNAPLHDSTPYPAATQYSTYPDSAPSIAYTPSQPPNTYTAYPSGSDPVEAPLLAAFAAQASQVHANQSPPQWRASSNLMNSTSQSWQQWTSTMAGNLEPQDCYSANALMQLGARELPDGTSGANVQTGDAQAGVGVGVGQLDHGHLSVSVGMGGTWPLNIFDVGAGQAGS